MAALGPRDQRLPLESAVNGFHLREFCHDHQHEHQRHSVWFSSSICHRFKLMSPSLPSSWRRIWWGIWAETASGSLPPVYRLGNSSPPLPSPPSQWVGKTLFKLKSHETPTSERYLSAPVTLDNLERPCLKEIQCIVFCYSGYSYYRCRRYRSSSAPFMILWIWSVLTLLDIHQWQMNETCLANLILRFSHSG